MFEGKMLEQELKSFKSGKKICDDLVRDYINKANPSYSSGNHRIRIAAMDETNFWEGLGYCVATIGNCLKHPKIMYRLIFKK